MKKRILIAALLLLALAALIFAFGGCRPMRQLRPDTGQEQQTPDEDGNSSGGGISNPFLVTVTYNFTGDTDTSEERVIQRGGQAPCLSVPDRSDAFFLYWATSDGTEWDFSKPVTQDLRLYTEWRYKESFIVIFCDPSGSETWQSVKEGDTAQEPDLHVRAGYFLEGWYTDSTLTNKFDLSTPITKKLTLYAKLSPVPVTLSFKYDAEYLPPIHTHYGETITLPDITPVDGKIFYAYLIVGTSGNIFTYSNELTVTIGSISDLTLEPTFIPAWSFEPINGGTEYSISHYETSSTHYYPETETLTLPSTYEGKPVTEIAPDAFKNARKIRKLIIPGSYRTVGKNSFSDCYILREVIMEEGVQTIGTNAFDSCWALINLSLPQSLTNIGSGAFYGTGLTEVSLPSNLEVIGTNAFEGYGTVIHTNRAAPAAGWKAGWSGNCTVLYEGEKLLTQGDVAYKIEKNGEALLTFVLDTSLTSLEIPDTVTDGATVYPVTRIENNALEDLIRISTLFLPDSLEWMGDDSLPNSSSLQFTQKDGMSFLGSRTNPYLVLCEIDYTQHYATIPAQTHIVCRGLSAWLYSLQIEENSSLTQIGKDAFIFYWDEPFDIYLPAVKYLESGAFSGEIPRIFYEGEGEHWAPDWDESALSFDLTKGQQYTDETGEWFLQDGKATLLRLAENIREGVYLPSSVTADGQTFRVSDIVSGAFYGKEHPFLYIPESVTYLDGQNLRNNLSYILLQADSAPDTWENFTFDSNRLYCGIDRETLLDEDGTLFVSANGTARALCRYSPEKYDGAYALPRTAQGVPVDGILSGFFPSVDYTILVLFDNIVYIEEAKTNYYVSAVYTQAESAPEGWKEDWFMEWLNKSIPVYYGISFPRETPATYTFITEGSAVSPVQAYFLINEQKTQLSGKYFWGWYENAEFTGTPVSFPYFGNATTLYARFETERIQDGKSYDTAFELEEGVSREISIGAGEEVFLRFAALELNQRYTVKSTGDADTYGELYKYSSSLITSADGGGAGENFSITFTKYLRTYYLVVKLTDKTVSATVGIIYFAV